MHDAAAAIPLLIWLYLLFGRGWFWREPNKVARRPAARSKAQIVAVVPARNEAGVVGRALASLLRQGIQVILVDDGSSDGTAEIARSLDVTVLRGKPLPSGWTGKLWAMSQGVAYAEQFQPEYLLFTDADIQHGPRTVVQLLQIAQEGNYDLASYMVKLACVTTAEKALIPAFVFFFFMLYPPAWISSARFKTAGAAGGCILIRTDALRRIGGLQSIRDQVIDDCALARMVKGAGGRVWLGLTKNAESIRSYGGFAEVGRMISRTAFNQLQHSPLLLAGTVAGLFVTYLLPPILLMTPKTRPRILGGITWSLMTIAYLPIVRFHKRSWLWSLSLPLVALFYTGATVHSAFQYWRGRGGLWKGRAQEHL